jgi:hypothetical protein
MNDPNDMDPKSVPGSKTLEAGEFVLKDAAGRVGARLDMGPAGPRLVLYGESGKPRAALSVLGEKPGLILEDANDKVRVALGVGDNVPYFFLADASGKTGMSLGFTDNRPFLSLNDANGTPRASLGIGSDNEPGLYLYDINGKPRVFLGTVLDDPILHLSDTTGKRSTSIKGRQAYIGYAAFVCWTVLLIPLIIRTQSEVPLFGGIFGVAGIVLTSVWVRYRWRWWKTKGRAMASYIVACEARERDRQ